MNWCIIFGGSGYIGTRLANHFLKKGRFTNIHIADIQPTSLNGSPGITYSNTDVRDPIPEDLLPEKPAWIINLAAIHREPGHKPHEYYMTNIPGAYNICRYATAVDCRNIYFSSSISVYGPTNRPTSEMSPLLPTTPYGGSKFGAETIHIDWYGKSPGRRLIISRPGVIYGPGDPGNIMRMINAIRKGYFAFPGSPGIYKSYGYIYGLIDSVDFSMNSDFDFFCYNYVETPTEPLGKLVRTIKKFLSARAIVLPLPLWLLMPIARIIQFVLGTRNPVHPVRVKKAATPTHIIPQSLIENGFEFRYTFEKSLHHWQSISPEEFDLPKTAKTYKEGTQLKLARKPETSRVDGRPEISKATVTDTGEDTPR